MTNMKTRSEPNVSGRFRCHHQLSWPRRMPSGDHYQICIYCGTRFGYDWEAMRQLKRLPPEQLVISSQLISQTRATVRWVSRERRVDCQTPVIYRFSETQPWLCGQCQNVSRSGVLVGVATQIPTGTVLEMILEEPRELSGLESAQVRCTVVIRRTLPVSGGNQWLLGCARQVVPKVKLSAA